MQSRWYHLLSYRSFDRESRPGGHGLPPLSDFRLTHEHMSRYFPNQPGNGAYSCIDLGPSTPVPGICAGDRTASASTGCTWCACNISKEASVLSDQAIRDNAIAQLRIGAASSTPFFVGVGFHKPQ